jgi:hypothetical protein
MTATIPRGLRHARTLSLLIGVFLILTGLRDLLGILPRWDPSRVTWPLALRLDCLLFVTLGTVLLLPWPRIMRSGRWAWALGILSALCLVFAMAMISEVMAKNYLAKGMGMRAKPPIFQAVLLFAVMAQPPVAWFLRRPDLLD